MNNANERLVIGLIIEDIFTDFAKETIQSAMNSIPQNKDIRLVVLSGRHDDTTDPDCNEHRYKTIYNTIYDIGRFYRFDGLIIALGNTEMSLRNLSDMDSWIKSANIPAVYVAAPKDRAPSVNYDNEMGIREAIDFLVHVNGYTNICMLGGRDDNADAMERRDAFIRSLEENHIHFNESLYEPSDMSVCSQDAARHLLFRNPDVQAIFCVNDAVAEGLYDVMKSRGLTPGRDVLVFGFDNTRAAGELSPTLASIGSSGGKLGQIAVDMLLDIIAGKEVESVVVPTRLYGKESLNYEIFEFTTIEMMRGNEQFINRMFDECFYRYHKEDINREDVNLKRLFYEIISRMLRASKMRYISIEDFTEVQKMVEIFFRNGAMEYTDATKFINSIGRLQGSLNSANKSPAANVMLNRLFLRMREMAIRAISIQSIREHRLMDNGREQMLEFLIEMSDHRVRDEKAQSLAVTKFDHLGYKNASLFLFDTPVICDDIDRIELPDTINLRCITRNGELYILPEERQICPMSRIFDRDELNFPGRGTLIYPIFYSIYLYGFMVNELIAQDMDRGEYITGQLAKVFYCTSNEAPR
ncbi:MAG: LacI family DNA-binding transcriptional regulator [Eubacterium sp.]|nr:LacI family DNA-binding transcriptional regulator [Eubacterium sp.]